MRRIGLVLGYLLLLSVFVQAYSYDDYSSNNYSSNQYQNNLQIQTYNSFSPQRESFQLNLRDDFMKNPAYSGIVRGYESNGGLKDFLADKVAPNVNVQNFVGSEVKSGSSSISFSAPQNQFLAKSYENVKLDGQNQVKQFDAFTSRGDFTQCDQVSQVQYNQDKLVTSFQVQTPDNAGNICQQKVENIQYQSNADGARFQNLLQFAQAKAEQPGTYGFQEMADTLKEFPEPAKQLPVAMDLTVVPPQGAASLMKVTNMQWQQEKLVGFDAQIQQGKELTTVSVKVNRNDKGLAESVSLEANGNKKTFNVESNQSVEDLSKNILKGINPVALLSGSDIQIGEGKVVYLAQNFNGQGQLAGAAKGKELDYGKPGWDQGKNSLKQDIKTLEQTAPGITRDTVWDKDIKRMGKQQLTEIKAAITSRVEKGLETANQQPTIKTAWGSTIAKPADQTLKLENNRITSAGSFETPEGKLSNVTFKLQEGNLQAVSGVLTKPDNTQVMLGENKKEALATDAQGVKENGGFIQSLSSFVEGVGKAIGSVVTAASQGISDAWQTVSNWLGGKTNEPNEGKPTVADNLAVQSTTERANPANTRIDETTQQRQELGKALTHAENTLGKDQAQIASLDKQNAKLEENTQVLGEMFKSMGYREGSAAIAKDTLYSSVLTDEIKARAEGIKVKTEKMGQALAIGDLKQAAKLEKEIKGMQTRFEDRVVTVQKILDVHTEGARILLKEVAGVLKNKNSTPEKVINSLSTVYTLLKSEQITSYLYISLKQQLVSKLDGPNKEIAFAMLKNDIKEVTQAQAIMQREVKNIPEGAVKGDFAKPTLGGMIGQVTVYFTPIGPLAAMRDAVANGIKIVESKGQDGKLGFVLSVVGIIPGVGEIKALPRLFEAFQAAKSVERVEQASTEISQFFKADTQIVKSLATLPKLSDDLAVTFRSGQYTSEVLKEDVVLYRVGTKNKPLGQFFSKEKPVSEIQSRIDKAIPPVWKTGQTAQIDTIFEVKIPKGTVVYTGEVAAQGNFYVGGTQQIVVGKSWKIEGIEILNTWPIK